MPMESPEAQADLLKALARCEAEQRRIESEGPGPLWLWVLGWTDWEAEKELIRREKFH